MSTHLYTDVDKRKIELPKALREIVKILAEEGPQTYEELAQKLEKDETTIIRQAQKLIEMEVCVKVEKENKAAIALAEGVEVDEEGNVYMPSPFEDPVEHLKELLEEAGIKGRKLRWIIRLVESNPATLSDPNALYDTLTGAGIRRQLAQQIVKAFFGTNFVPPMQSQPYSRPYYNPMMHYNIPPYNITYPYDREILRLEMKLEKLVEALKEKKEEKTSYPVVRRIKTDEHGRPVEIIEEPVVPGISHREDNTQLLIKIMEMRQQDREMIFKIIEENRRAIEKLSETTRNMVEKLMKTMAEQEQKHREEIAKLREEMVRKDAEWQKKFYEDKLEDLKQSINGLKEWYENEMKKTLDDLKKEWEWREKIRELEERRGLRDVIIDEVKAVAKEMRDVAKDLRSTIKEYMEVQIKKPWLQQKKIPEVTSEEKKRILEVLRKRSGRKEEKEEPMKEEKKEEEEPKIQLKVVGKEG